MYSIDARRPVAPPFFIKLRSAAAVDSTHRGDRHAQKEPPSELLAYMLKIEAGQSHPNSNVLSCAETDDPEALSLARGWARTKEERKLISRSRKETLLAYSGEPRKVLLGSQC
jgi:hypothetical protein